MTLDREDKLINDLIREDRDHTLKDFIETRDEIDKIESWRERKAFILNHFVNGHKSIRTKDKRQV